MMRMRFCVLGAGVAGRSAARVLREKGVDVDVFDKGRGGCGRVATRRGTNLQNEFAFDYGAICFTMDPLKEEPDWFKQGIEANVIAPWTPVIGVSDDGKGYEVQQERIEVSYVAVPGMSKLGNVIDPHGDGFIRFSERIQTIDNESFVVSDSGTKYGPYDVILVTFPPPQAIELLDGVADFVEILKTRPEIEPSRTLMVGFDRELPLQTPFGILYVHDGPLGNGAKIVHNSTKPGRSAWGDSYVVELGPEKSRESLEVDNADTKLLTELLDGFYRACGLHHTSLQPSYVSMHRWRYSFDTCDITDGIGFLHDETKSIYYAGSSCSIDGSIMSAIESGKAAAEHMWSNYSSPS